MIKLVLFFLLCCGASLLFHLLIGTNSSFIYHSFTIQINLTTLIIIGLLSSNLILLLIWFRNGK
jgi:hypothetical protein